MSKYDSIKTASDLVADVQLNGLSTDQEDICRAQDIFGHTSIEELARLANDTGMNNAQGEPDPKGTWSSGRKATRGTFYMIVTSIWNWEEVTRFWNLYTNPQTEELKELRKEHKKLGGLYDSLLAHRDELEAEQKANNDAIAVLKSRAGDAQRRAEEAEAEVVRLKAKLYDLLVERKEAV
ncbi:MAG: hypothetical protein HFF62_04120 [Oscillospiraceae bacterium]|nr:hypothetical protein [Oscillospiraceae bacterium]